MVHIWSLKHVDIRRVVVDLDWDRVVRILYKIKLAVH